MIPPLLYLILLSTLSPFRAESGIMQSSMPHSGGSQSTARTINLPDHFPLTNGLRWKYDSSLGETVSWVTFTGGDFLVISESSPLKVRQRLRIAGDAVLLLESESKTLLTHERRTYRPPMLRLPLRIEPGQSWTWEGKEEVDGETISSRVNGVIEKEEKIKVPAGEFLCLKVKVTTISDDGTASSSTQWLAPGVGIVKGVVEIKPGGFTGFIVWLLGLDHFELELEEITRP